MKTLKSNQRGDTLVEVLLSVAILGTILAISYALASRSFRILQISKDRIQATLIMQEQAEGFHALRDEFGLTGFCSRAGGNDKRIVPVSGVWQVQNAPNAHPNYPRYTVKSNVVCAPSGTPTSATVSTSISWQRAGGGTDSSTLVSVLRSY